MSATTVLNMATTILGGEGGVLGKTAAGVDFGLNSSAASYFGLTSQDLILSSNPKWKKIENWPIIPVGKPVSLIALLPELGSTSLPTTAVGKDATSLKYSVPAQVKWKVQFIDVDKKVSGDVPAGIKGSTDVVSHTASTSFDDVLGTHQILSGDLNSLQLTILPWPYSGGKDPNKLDDSMMRILRVYLEITIFFPGAGPTTFSLPDGLFGIVQNWYSIFGTNTAIDPPESLFVPLAGAANAGKSDPLAPFRNMFNAVLDNVDPEVGQPTTILLKPQDQLSKIPMTVSEIVDNKPDVRVNAAIDFGAMIQGITEGVMSLFNAGSPSPALSEAEMNIGKILGSILSLPIAVKMDGLNATKVLKPMQPLPIPSLTSIPDTALTLVNLPIGNLNVLSTIQELGIEFIPVGDQPVPSFVFENLSGLLGGKLTIAPVFARLDAVPSVLNFKIKIPMLVKLPGRKFPLSFTLPPIPIQVNLPMIPLPQIGLFTRAFFQSFYENPNDPTWYGRDLLLSMCPHTKRYLPTVDMIRAALKKLSKILRTVLDMVPPGRPVGTFLKNTPHDHLTKLSDTIRKMLEFLNHPNAKIQVGTLPEYMRDVSQSTVLENQIPAWFKKPEGQESLHWSNISAMLWIGPPKQLRDFTLSIVLWPRDNPNTRQILFSPKAAGVPAIIRNSNDPVIGLWLREFNGSKMINNKSIDNEAYDWGDQLRIFDWLYQITDEYLTP